MTREEFLAALDALAARYPYYTVEKPDAAGDIVLRRTGAEAREQRAASAKGSAFAQAIRGIMSTDTKKNPRGGGWV